MATQTSVDIVVYSNEDLSRDFTVRVRDPSLSASVTTPTLAQTVPLDLTSSEIKVQVRDAKTNSLLFTMSTDNSGAPIIDAANGKFGLRCDWTVVKLYKGRAMVYDVLLGSTGWVNVQRLWGGTLSVLPGVTDPDAS